MGNILGKNQEITPVPVPVFRSPVLVKNRSYELIIKDLFGSSGPSRFPFRYRPENCRLLTHLNNIVEGVELLVDWLSQPTVNLSSHNINSRKLSSINKLVNTNFNQYMDDDSLEKFQGNISIEFIAENISIAIDLYKFIIAFIERKFNINWIIYLKKLEEYQSYWENVATVEHYGGVVNGNGPPYPWTT